MLRHVVRLGALGALLAFPAAASAVYPGTNGPIVFELGDYLLRQDIGSIPTFVTDFNDEDHGADSATVSADGALLAFTASDSSTGQSTYQLASMTLDDEPGGPIAGTGVQGFFPAILPEGDAVVYSNSSSPQDASAKLFTAGLAAPYNVTALVGNADRGAQSPVVSPDGDTIFYTAIESRPEVINNVTFHYRWYQIRSHRLSNHADAAVTSFVKKGPIRALDVAPDGSELLVQEATDDGIDPPYLSMRAINPVTGATIRTPKAGMSAHGASYSPDGERIAYSPRLPQIGDGENAMDDGELRVMDVDGTNDQLLFDDFQNIYPRGVEWATGGGIVVTETADGEDAAPDDGICDGDAGTVGAQCTLHAAIQTANAKAGADEIRFDVGDGGAQTIVLDSPLPEITGQVEIDGDTQPHDQAQARALIALDGAGAGAGADGISISGGTGSLIRGLNLHGFKGTAIVLGGEGGHKVEGNWIGFKRTVDGYATAGNASGVDVTSSNNTIGGPGTDQRNVISGNGNPEAARAYLDSIDGEVGQATLHATFLAFGTGIVISQGGVQGNRIEGNYIGPDPTGGRFGQTGGLTSTFGIMIGPDAESGGGIVSSTTIVKNVISGNLFGVLALPESEGSGVVDALTITDNVIGARPDGTEGPGLGGLVGVSISGLSSNVLIDKNRIHGQAIAVTAKAAGPTLKGNLIGTDDDLGSLIDSMSSENPSLGLHNIFGVLLAGTDGAIVGGPGDQRNRILGNLIGVLMAGDGSHGNALLGNAIGSTDAPAMPESGADLGTIIGVLMIGGSDNDVGDPGAGNTFSANALGLMMIGTQGGHVQDNQFGGSVFGMLTVQTKDLEVGGAPGAGNYFAANLAGTVMAAWAPTAAELAKLDVPSTAKVKEADRELAFDAPATQGSLNFIEGSTPVDIQETAVALGSPPGSGTPARGSRSLTSTGTLIRNNVFGADRGGAEFENGVGAWLAGSQIDVRIEENVFTRGLGGGLWLGSPSYYGSSVAEANNVTLKSNRIWDNYKVGSNVPGVGALGFDLLEHKPVELGTQAFGATVNDAGDADSGPNGLQNTPVLTSVTTAAVAGTLSSKPSTAYKVELFANAFCNAFGSGEGQTPLRIVDVTTDGAGNGAFSLPVTLPAGQDRVSANATGPEGTSEFSACVAAGPPPVATPTPTPSPSASPTPTATPTPAGDTKPPDATTKGGKSPKAGDPVTVSVTSSEDGTVTATGSITTSGGTSAVISAKAKKVKVALTTKRSAIKARQTLKLTLKPKGKKNIAKLKKAMRKGARATAVIKIVLTDKAGNKTTKTVRVKLRKG
jgi:hypothetical protein